MVQPCIRGRQVQAGAGRCRQVQAGAAHELLYSWFHLLDSSPDRWASYEGLIERLIGGFIQNFTNRSIDYSIDYS